MWGVGNLVFHGPREEVVPFFESMHFYVPERKAVSDFLQEVTSKKDQQVCSHPCVEHAKLCSCILCPSLVLALCAWLVF